MFADLIPAKSLKTMQDEAKAASDKVQADPVISGLAAHVRSRWEMLERYHEAEIRPRLVECLNARDMKYSPEKLAEIRAHGGSEIFMGIVSTKCRTATAWLRDALLGTGQDKPWSLSPTPVADVPPDVEELLQSMLTRRLEELYATGAQTLAPDQLGALGGALKDAAARKIQEESAKRVARMEKKIEDQLVEGGFSKALFEFIDDVATFPFAVLKGPVPRKRRAFKYTPDGLQIEDVIRDEWDRVDPFRFYWAPWSGDPQNGPIIEKHDLTRYDLENLIGVPGYDDDAIRTVLANFGGGSLGAGGDVEGDFDADADGYDDADDVVKALQLWDNIPASLLVEWGMDESELEDLSRSYPCEVWVVGGLVIRAELNYDPIGRKPYYATSFEKIPGRIAGKGVADLCLDAQNMCNAAARALANNMGISSGPQVAVNISRLPTGSNISQMSPWKIWQFKESDHGDVSDPIRFFQPNSNSGELMSVFNQFMQLADEVSGIPRYMTGQHVPGAGRTSSGLSMLISNAGKSIKQVVANVDNDVIQPLLERQYQRNLRYVDDPDFVGDIQIKAQGANSLVVKEAEAMRRSEFLRLMLESPVAQQIVGIPGIAELLRDMANNLNMNVDNIVPDRAQIEAQLRAAQAMQQQAMQQQAVDQQLAQQGGAAGPQNRQADGTQQGGRDVNFVSPRPSGA